jgi:two-component system nitrate/nitrite response regulator NarL
MLETLTSPSRRADDRDATVRVLVADAQPLFRDALVRAMQRGRAIELTHATDRIANIDRAIARHRPDVVVADRELLDGDLGELVSALDGGARLLLLAGDVAPDDVYRALEQGVAGYVSKDADADALCEAVRAVARGETRLDLSAQTRVASEIRLRGRDERPQLSPREQQILTLIAAGRTAPQVAGDLHISTATVKTHLLHLYEKLGVAERAAAVAEGMRLGLLE